MIGAAMRGELDEVEMHTDAVFGLHSPISCPGVPSELLIPSNTWDDGEAFHASAQKLAGLFVENFSKFENASTSAMMEGAPSQIL
jgi:phosphoenolpyruvate carboxykinase (ATP)